ncbi:hypothetical protein ACWF94_12475 [Streptomyces sp. NPDC055078]
MTTVFRTPVPFGFKFSADTAKLIKKRDDLAARLNAYRAKNADCQQINRTPYNHQNPRYVVPAIATAERELKDQEVRAVAGGKPLPDKEAHMAAVEARVAEYRQMVPALQEAVEKATQHVERAILTEMPALASQAMKETDKAQKEYVTAMEKARAARDSVSASVSRFLWAVSGSAINTPMGRGWDGSLEDDVAVWDSNGDGRITYKCAQDLGLVTTYSGDLVELREFVAENETEEPTTPFRSPSRRLSTATYSANGDGGFTSRW